MKNLITHAKCMRELGIKKGWVVFNEKVVMMEFTKQHLIIFI